MGTGYDLVFQKRYEPSLIFMSRSGPFFTRYVERGVEKIAIFSTPLSTYLVIPLLGGCGVV
jgi:hypothetical protein